MYFDKACIVCSAAALFMLLLSILCRFTAGAFLKKMLAEAENMSVTQNWQLRQCKLKFQNYYELNGGNMNVEIFVEKFLQEVRAGKCSFRMLNLLSGQLLLAAEMLCGAAVCVACANGSSFRKIWPYYALAFGGLYLYFAASGLVDLQGNLSKLKTTMVDFLENRMGERMRNAKRDSAYLDSFEERAPGAVKVKSDAEAGTAEGSAEAGAMKSSAEAGMMKSSAETGEKDELEVLLSEFLA